MPAGASAPPAQTHHFEVPRWLVILLFVAVEVIVILVMYYGSDWKYRTVIKKARQAMAEERWNDALASWATHVRNYPSAENAPTFRRDRARSYMGAGNYEAALLDLQFLFAGDEERQKDPELLEILAQCEARLGRADEARKTYEDLLKIAPANAAAHLYLGEQLLEKGQILDAARHFQAVPVEKYPEDLKAKWAPIEQRFLQEAAEGATPEGSTPTLRMSPASPAAGDRPSSPSISPTPAP